MFGGPIVHQPFFTSHKFDLRNNSGTSVSTRFACAFRGYTIAILIIIIVMPTSVSVTIHTKLAFKGMMTGFSQT